MAHIEKLSLHQSGICRSAFTNQFGKPSSLEDRAVMKWKRTPIKYQGLGHLSRVVMLGIPTDSLSPQSEPLRKPVTWINPAPAGAATYIEFAFTREDELAMQWQLTAKSAPRFIVDYFPLPSGDNFALLAHYDKAEERNVLVPASHHEERDLMFSTYNPWGSGYPARLSLPTLTKDHEMLILREIGGYPITKKQLAAFGRPFDTLTRTEVWAHKTGGMAQATNRNRSRPVRRHRRTR